MAFIAARLGAEKSIIGIYCWQSEIAENIGISGQSAGPPHRKLYIPRDTLSRADEIFSRRDAEPSAVSADYYRTSCRHQPHVDAIGFINAINYIGALIIIFNSSTEYAHAAGRQSLL